MRSLYLISRMKHFYTSKNVYFLNNLFKYNCDCRDRQKLLLIRCLSNSSSLQNIGAGDLQQEKSENMFDPKQLLWRIINEAFITQENLNVKPSVTVQQINDGESKNWQVSITMAWPEKFVVKAIAPKKSVAEKNSFYLACQKMKEYGILDENNNVIPQKITAFDNFNNCKSMLCNIYEGIWPRFGRKEYIPKFNTFQIPSLVGNEKYWKSELSLLYPEPKTFEGFSGRFREAEKIASMKALLWLKEQGIINGNNRLILFSKEDYLKILQLHSAPYSIHISKTIQNKMKSLQHVLENEDINFSDTKESEPNETTKNSEVYDIITEKLYQDLSEEEIISRSKEMYERNNWHAQNIDPEFQEIKRTVSELPVACRRKEILQLLEENQVLVLSGQTGCGKTTQVPQFILDHYINEKKGALCNIVVTQPRRISAISIAERVAIERGEEVGETIGYQVRLNKMLPSQKGAILYCTTGMLLRKLFINPTLKGISHIVVDEIHERNTQIDFLLILLKRVLETNKTIKVILMSASFNTYIFSSYFNKCPVIHVSGRNYPVKDYYLEEILNNVCYKKVSEDNKPALDSDLIVGVIKHIDEHEKPGAILCFLPGWHDMLTVKNKLLDFYSDSSKLMICYAHSRIPVEEQKKLFVKPPDGVRKVILSTNIAETSITVNDVVYVVDSGLHKGTFFDGNDAVATLATQRITKANVTQRSGRAGRVQPGACYHLYTRKTLMEMKDYPLPELLRMPLETVILDCKLYCPEIKAEDFLSEALNAPDRLSLQAGVNELQTIGILNETEQLTSLGNIVVNFGTHPRLSVALVYAAFLRCLDPVLTICAILTLGKEPFLNSLEDKSLIRKIKEIYDNSLISDHLSLSKIYEEWKKLSSDSDASEFITTNFLDEQSLNVISDLKRLFADNLFTAGIIDDNEAFSDGQNQYNENSNHIPSIFAALTAAFYPNVIKVLPGEIIKNRLNKHSLTYSLLKGQRAYIQKESIAANISELPTPWLIYFNALKSEARRLMMTSAVSSVPGICLPLLAGKKLLINEESSGNSEIKDIILVLDDHKKLHFSCTCEEAELLMQFRNNLNSFFHIYLRSLGSKSEKCDNLMSVFYSQFLPVLKNVLETPQIPFTKGLSYKFVNEDLVTEEL